MQIAASKDYLGIVKLLLSKGACPLSLPLDFAIFGGFDDVAELIIQNNREIINEGLYIHLAIEAKVFSDQQDNSKIVDLLLKNGANINTRNEMNRTPLHNATELRNYEIMQLLLYYKADIDAYHWPGRTPLQIAIISNDRKATSQSAVLSICCENVM